MQGTYDEQMERILRLMDKVPEDKLDQLFWFVEAIIVGRW